MASLKALSGMVALVLTLGISQNAAAEEPEDHGIFFGGVSGLGGAWIRHPELSGELRPGAYVALQMGWSLSQRLALGGEFTTWGTSILGTPVHLHTIGPRVEMAVHDHHSGPFVGLTVGLALTEGELEARAGGGAALVGGYRWPLGRWTTIAIEAGSHGHLYDNGSAVFPIVALQLRFHGSSP